MFRHVAMFKWTAEATGEQKAAVSERLAGLPAAIPEIKAYHFGADAGLGADNFDFVVVADFEDRETFITYRDHPAHQAAIAEVIAPIRATRAAAQYEF
ncbi:MAG TPA: Dabb family protein [Streptosporangiaceae bacterium]|jgi:hypothetical protein